MKVCFVAPRFHTNQAELVGYAVENGDSVVFIVLGTGASEVHDHVAPTIVRPMWFFPALHWFFGFGAADLQSRYRWSLPSIGAVIDVVSHRPDVFVIRNPNSLFGGCIALIAKAIGARVVFYTQTKIRRPRRPVRDFVTKLIIELLAVRWISPCLGEIDDPTPYSRMEYVPFCIRPSTPKSEWFRDGRVNIISVGKFVPRKEHDLLIRALSLLSGRYDVSLTIMGEVSSVTGEETYRDLARLASEVTYPVTLVANVSRSDVLRAMQESDLFVLASRDEPASVSQLEAMSVGLPVVVSSSNGTKFVVSDNGRVFESGSLESLARQIEELICDRDGLKSAGERSFQIVCSDHSPEAVYAATFLGAGTASLSP